MTAQTILPANTLSSGAHDVANSLRFNIADSARLTRTQTAGDRNKATLSAWVKRSKLGANQGIFGIHGASSDAGQIEIRFQSSGEGFHISGQATNWRRTSRAFRDTSAWYHLVVAFDTTQGTASNRVKVYVNGVQETAFAASGDPDEDEDLPFGLNGATCSVGSNFNAGSAGEFFGGYLAEVVLIDGQQLDATSFGEFDSDSPTIWKPKKISGLTFGNNGFYMEFKESGTSQNSSGLGADTSGNDNHFATSGLASIDQCTDTCTNNFCTFTAENHTAANFDLTEGNLQTSRNTGTSGLHGSSIMPTTGKWYFEVKIGEAGSGDRSRVGVMNYQKQLENSTYSGVINTPQQILAGCTTSCKSGKHFEGDGAGVMEEYTASGDYADGDIVQVAMDLDNKAIYFGRNGTFLTRTGNSGGDPTSGASKTGAITTNTNIMDGSPMTAYTGLSVGSGSDTSEMFFNFGNPPFAISSGNNDGNGYGNFEYAPPTGYLAWCSKNLAESG